MPNKYAHPIVRFISHLINSGLGVVVGLGLVWLLSTSSTPNVLADNLLNIFVFGVVAWSLIYSFLQIFFISKFGGDIGQLFVGIRVVNEDQKNLSFPMAFFRFFVGNMLCGMLFGLGYWWTFKDEKRQGWHDKISHSFVVVNNKSGWVIGLLALLAFMILHGVLITGIAVNFSQNSGLYQSIGDGINKVIKKDQTTYPQVVPQAPRAN